MAEKRATVLPQPRAPTSSKPNEDDVVDLLHGVLERRHTLLVGTGALRRVEDAEGDIGHSESTSTCLLKAEVHFWNWPLQILQRVRKTE